MQNNALVIFNIRGVTNVTFEQCDVAQIEPLLRMHQPAFVLAKNAIQFFMEVSQKKFIHAQLPIAHFELQAQNLLCPQVDEFLKVLERIGASYIQVAS